VSKGGHKAPAKVPSNLAFQKYSIQNTRKDWLRSFLVHGCYLIPTGPPLWCMPEKIHYNPNTHYPFQLSKIPCEFFVDSRLLASVLVSNYPNVNPKCELQAWWTKEWFLFQHNTAKLLKCELLLMLVAKLQQRNPKILPLISTLLSVHLSSLSLSLSHCTGLSSQTLWSGSNFPSVIFY